MNMNEENTKKGKKIMKITAKKIGKKKKTMGYHDTSDHPVVTSPQIDKLTVIVDIHDPALHGQMVHELLCFVEQKEAGFIKRTSTMRYPTSVSILSPDADGKFHDGNPAVLFQATAKDNPARQVRLEFNPCKLFATLDAMQQPIAKDHLDLVFMSLWGSGFFDFLYHGRVKRIDVCRDILDRSPEDYFFKRSHVQASHSFASDGCLDTLYLGKRGSGSQVIVYNKSKQLHGKNTKDNTIRVEAFIAPKKKLKVIHMDKLDDPFKRVDVYSMLVKNPPQGEGHLRAFQDSCRFRGISNAIKRQPQATQIKLKKMIQQSVVPWWKMDDVVWTQAWDEALKNGCLHHVPQTAQPLDLKKICGE